MYKKNDNWVAYILGFGACFLLRLIPFRPPNIEPILATLMPYSRAYGPRAGFIFAFASIFLFDLFTGKVGPWTLVTGLSYGMLGVWATYFFKRRKNSRRGYVTFAIIGTLFFDITTGFTVGPIFFGQLLSTAIIGQIPFTALHLVGNISFALVLSPALYRYVIENKKLKTYSITSFIQKFV